jgi:guanylate kinase
MSHPSAPDLFTHKRDHLLFVISAPSGAGKSTLLNGIRHFGDFEYSVSCTTRAPRPGERDGIDYHFLSRTAFEEQIQKSNLLEWAEVHGNYYGTLRSEVLDRLASGVDVLVDVDVQGAQAIRACDDPRIRSVLIDIFLAPPSMEELERRLRHRGTETPQQLQTRLTNASREMDCWHEYQYLIVSGSPAADQVRFRSIMEAERLRIRPSQARASASSAV